jgi:hypothetical protein
MEMVKKENKLTNEEMREETDTMLIAVSKIKI